MKSRHWIAVVAIAAACLLTVGAVQSASIQFTTPIDPGSYVRGGNGKAKGPKCRDQVLCNQNGEVCQHLVCGNNPCDCWCEQLPNCEP